MPRVLHLTSPPMVGDDVRAAQRALGLYADGVYGKATGSEVAAWKYRMGFPRDAINTGLGAEALRILHRRNGELLPVAYAARRLKRMRIGFKPGWGIAKHPPYNPADATAAMERWATLGWHERPAGSNVVPQMVAVGEELDVILAQMGYPWCAHSAMLAGLVCGGASAKAGIVTGGFNGRYVPEIESVAQQGKHGLRIVGASQARRGDLVTMNFDGGLSDHIGRLRAAPSGGQVQTVEGNTSAGDSGSQNNGDGVYLRERPTSIVAAYIRDS